MPEWQLSSDTFYVKHVLCLRYLYRLSDQQYLPMTSSLCIWATACNGTGSSLVAYEIIQSFPLSNLFTRINVVLVRGTSLHRLLIARPIQSVHLIFLPPIFKSFLFQASLRLFYSHKSTIVFVLDDYPLPFRKNQFLFLQQSLLLEPSRTRFIRKFYFDLCLRLSRPTIIVQSLYMANLLKKKSLQCYVFGHERPSSFHNPYF